MGEKRDLDTPKKKHSYKTTRTPSKSVRVGSEDKNDCKRFQFHEGKKAYTGLTSKKVLLDEHAIGRHSAGIIKS